MRNEILLFALVALACGACTTPTKDATKPGTSIDRVYLRDAHTGKCVEIKWNGGRLTSLHLAEAWRCRQP